MHRSKEHSMKETLTLNAVNLSKLPFEVRRPGYDRNGIQPGIVHIGIGGFHRAHQAYYLDELMEQGLGERWGICGVALLESDRKIYQTLLRQDGLYTLVTPDGEGKLSARVIGSIIEVLFAPDDPEAVIEKLAHPSTKIITLTITEGGYNFTPEGKFNWDNPSVLWDLENPDQPRTIFGYLTAALKLRSDNSSEGSGGITIQSCDNLEHNGAVLQSMLTTFIAKAAPDISGWVDRHVAFPNSMVDRITPVTTPALADTLAGEFGVEDNWPVISESFIQWIIEDNYASGRPQWERAGAQMVRDVAPYEKMKIRLLNGGHTLVGLFGDALGHQYIHESVRDPRIAHLFRQYMDAEVTPTLDTVEGVDLDSYKQTLIERFSNTFLKDSVGRIISESAAKIPKFILPVIQENLSLNRSIRLASLVVAGWYVYLLRHVRDPGSVEDARAAQLLALVSKAQLSGNHQLFLTWQDLFGDIARESQFRQAFLEHVNGIEKTGWPRWLEFQSHIT